MPGMNDNPLVGEYTKGISKDGVEYFRNLEMRARFENARLSPIARDMQMGLFRAQKETLNRSVSLTGLGRFAVKTVTKPATVVVPQATKSDVKVVYVIEPLTMPKVAEKAISKVASKAIKVDKLSAIRLLYEKQYGL